ncbi:cobalt ECF transporter T component CbiQ [Pantanalinema rosaneae CENA516]|uniref:cobalt ECF transporter T component CbiQ n=1 Tax=Pantanalinema rosaneae TaxID=1620701 RepID=UPI003D701F28
MHHQIDTLAHTNQLRSLPPEHKLGFAIALFLLGYLAPAHVQGLMVLWLFLWVVKYARIPAQIYLKLLSLPISFLLLSLPALLIGMGTVDHLTAFAPDVVWGMPIGSIYLYLSQQGIEQARAVFVRAIALTSCLYFILLTVPMFEIIRVLNRLGCPVLVTELMGLMYRFIFILTDTVGELLTAQQSRMGYGTWRIGMRSLSVLVGQLLHRTLHNYRQLTLGLTARGYTGELRVWHRRRYQANRRYTSEAIGGYLLLLTLTGFHYHTILC